MTKKCPTCGEVKGLDEFGKNPATKDGLNYNCRYCRKEYQKEYKAKNKERIKEYRAEYEAKNKDRSKERHKEYRLQLTDGIVRKYLQGTLGPVEITPELIEMKRSQILMYREIKNIKGILKNGTNGTRA